MLKSITRKNKKSSSATSKKVATKETVGNFHSDSSVFYNGHLILVAYGSTQCLNLSVNPTINYYPAKTWE